MTGDSTGRRVVVAAPYPTMGGPEARATLSRVRALVAQGHDVFVISPRPSAAHAHADPGSPRGAARLATLVRSDDELILRLDAGALAVGSDSPKLLPGRVALAGAIRRASRCELVIDRVPPAVSARWVSLVAGAADVVTVATDGERDALAAAGLGGSSVVVDPDILPAVPAPANAHRSPRPLARADLPPGATAAQLEALVKQRAFEQQTPADQAFGPGAPAAASKALRSIPPLERPAVRSNNPGFVAVKRVQIKLLAWMFDWVIQHVNRLHQATIESLDAAGSPDQPKSSR